MNAQRPIRHRQTIIRLTLLAFLLQQAWIPSYGAPAQSPLVNRPEGKPLPNLMLTLDGSGSMTQHYLPEGTFKVNGEDVDFKVAPGTFLFNHPRELKKNRYTDGNNWGDSRFITSVPPGLDKVELTEAERTVQYQARSPQVNSIYYNPAIRYRPWTGILPDGSTYTFTNADPKAVKLDPLALDPNYASMYPAGWVDTTSTVDLTDETTTYNLNNWHRAKAGQKSFTPAMVYILPKGLSPNLAANYVVKNLNTTGDVEYGMAYPGRDDCTVVQTNTADSGKEVPGSTKCLQKVELQNFANWFAFYRSRLFIAQGALPDSLNPLSNQFRIGWGGLHSGITYTNGIPSDNYVDNKTYDVDGVPSLTVQRGVREWTTDTKLDLTRWMRVLKTYKWTPTRQAVLSVRNYFKREDNQSPWASDMKNGNPINAHLSCRRSYNMVLTDGYYNTSVKTPLTQNVDQDGSQSIDGLRAPFSDSTTGTLADYVMDSWLNDLQPKLSNDLTPITQIPQGNTEDDKLLAKIKSDPATHQHLTYFFMGFGITGNLLTQDVLQSPSAYNAELLRLAKCDGSGANSATMHCWPKFDPDSFNTNGAERIDDIWHATLNSRGQYFNISDPQDLKTALAAIVNRSTSNSFKEGGLATSSTELIDGNIKFVPEYTPYTWTGSVTAYVLDGNGKVKSTLWEAESTGDSEDKKPRTMPLPSERNIHVWNKSSASAVPLDNSDLQPALQAFLRGSNAGGDYREHDPKHLLPDFIDSTPLFVKGAVTQAYSGDDFPAYLRDKAGRERGLLFIGGNGGMAHAFSTETGRELFAYVPRDAQDKLRKIASKNYGYPGNYHEFTVNGQLVEGDVKLKNGVWENIVVGTMGAGGKSIFAFRLDTSNPQSNLGSSTLKWDITSNDLGYVTSTPQIGRLPNANGDFRIFVGNGVDSENGRAALLAIDPNDGSITSIIPGNQANGGVTSGQTSGMGGVTLVRDRQTGNVTTIYAGDTLGQLWRFDVDTDGNIVTGYGGAPLFTAKVPLGGDTRQPILAAPLVYPHPLGGQIIVFNTGRLLYETDSANTDTQTVYGIWDKTPTTQSSVSKSAPDIKRENLQAQVIKGRQEVTRNGGTATFFDLTSDSVSWRDSADGQTVARLGWYLDLNVPEATGFRYPKAIYDPQRFGKSVLISSVTPGETKESCTESRAKGYAFLISALTGGQSKVPTLDVNGDGVVTKDGDQLYSGFTYDGGSQRILTRPDDDGSKDPTKPPRKPSCTAIGSIQSGTGDMIAQGEAGGAGCEGLTVKDRIWRQLFNPPHP